MTVEKLSISFDPALGEAVRAAARQHGAGVSRWLAEAAEAKLRAEALSDHLDAWEAEHGPLTEAELSRAADERLGRASGILLGIAGSTDAVDASVVAVCEAGDRILTSDAEDLIPLVDASGRAIRVISC